MTKFLKRIFLFLIPILIFTGVPAYLFLRTGENFISESRIRKLQKSGAGDYLIGYYYNESNYRALKKISIEELATNDVMMLGSSRVTQFRDFMFEKPFFNCGYTVSTITQVANYLESMPEKKIPNVLFLGLDQWMFNENWDPVDFHAYTDFFDPKSVKIAYEPNPKQFLSLWIDLLESKFPLKGDSESENLSTKKIIGINANFYQMGFRPDGSFYYGDRIKGLLKSDPSVKDFGFHDTYERIKKGVFRFEYGEQVNPKALRAIEDLIDFCKEKKIKLVIFLPPFAPSVVQKLQNSGNHQYIQKLPELLSKYAINDEVEIWDFTNIEMLESDDKEFLDGFHASEVSDLRILIHMVENNSLLGDYTDLEEMKNLLNFRKNELELKSDD